jgi:hypothetical protein
MQTKCNDFWKWFEANSEVIFNFEKSQAQIFNSLANELKKIDGNLTFEFGPIKDDKREFVISADGIKNSFNNVEKLYESHPELPKWIIKKFRQRKEMPYTIEVGGIAISPKDIYYSLFEDGKKVGIRVFIKDYDKNNGRYKQLMFIFLDMALGEYDMETKVGQIEIFDFNSEYFSKALPANTIQENFDLMYKDINK